MSMQISNDSLYQNLSQYKVRSSEQTPASTSARPVIIEGQILNDKDTQQRSSSLKRTDSDRDDNSRFTLQDNDQDDRQSTASTDTADKSTSVKDTTITAQSSNAVLQTLTQDQAIGYSVIKQNSAVQTANNDSNASFPYGNRRSFNGLSGSSLIIQNYLNNSPAVSMQQSYSPAGVDFFV